MIPVAVATFALMSTIGPPDAASGARTWEIRYDATVTDIPAGTRSFRMWIPAPQDDQHQTISNLVVDAPLGFTQVTDPDYGNRVIQFEAAGPLPDSVAVTVTFVVERVPARRAGDSQASELHRWLGPDSLVPVTGEIAGLAQSVTAGLADDRARAEAIYAHILRTMRYDKSGTGWGRGDALFACSERRGNCTDIHSLLIGMARAAGIPARFVMGFPVPADGGQGEIAGYHCWADLYLEGLGWVPVDASEAIKHPELAQRYFGWLDPNRVAFTLGRDIRLGNGDHAPRVNYFIYPHVELEGAGGTAAVRCRVTYREPPASRD